jgi:hypothetical protein
MSSGRLDNGSSRRREAQAASSIRRAAVMKLNSTLRGDGGGRTVKPAGGAARKPARSVVSKAEDAGPTQWMRHAGAGLTETETGFT